MSANAAFASTPKYAVQNFATANTARDGTGTIAILLAGGASGTKVERVRFQAGVTTTAGVIRVFKRKTGSGTWRLWREILVTAITPSTTVEAFSAELDCTLPGNICLLESTDEVGIATHNAEAFNAHAEYGDY